MRAKKRTLHFAFCIVLFFMRFAYIGSVANATASTIYLRLFLLNCEPERVYQICKIVVFIFAFNLAR